MVFKDGVSQKALAENLKISRTMVRTLTDKGVFKRDEHKQISLSQAKKAYKTYRGTLQETKKQQAKSQAAKLLKGIDVDDKDESFKRVYDRWIASAESDPIAVLNEARAYLTALQVKQEKLKTDELEGRLFSAEKINADAETVGMLIRSNLMTLPSRVSTICEGRKARDIESIIMDELNRILEDLQKLFVTPQE